MPDTGYAIDDVKLDGTSVGAVSSYTISNVTANHKISATFAKSVFTITATSGAHGSISPSGATAVNSGDSQTYSIVPDTGYAIDDVKVDGTSVGAVSSYTISNVTANHKISATFVKSVFTITSTAGAHGSISPLGATSVNSGDSQTYSIVPDTGYAIDDVKVDGTSVGAVSSYTISNVMANHKISATFAKSVFTITSTAGAHGSISPLGATAVNSGDSQTYSIMPDMGYAIDDVKVDGTSVGAVSSYTISNVTANHRISATFAKSVFTITATAGAHGSITPSGATSVNSGDSQTFSIVPDTGYAIDDVKVDGTSVGAVSSYTISNVTANHRISATFAKSGG